MASCPFGYSLCEGICHFRIGDHCYFSVPPKPISEFRTNDQRIADLETKATELESKPVSPELIQQKPKFTGGIAVP